MAIDITTRPRLGTRAAAIPRAGTGVAVFAITALAAVLRFANFALVPSNSFYDAAVRSMGLSWHNFFFGAFEPGAQVSVDKTPVDLWLQVASTKLFGFSSVAVRLPEALAAVAAVPLLYDLVRRLFGRKAGLGAAAALAVLPISVVTGHSDTMDSLMMLLDVLAAWLVVVGAQRRSTWFVVAAGAVLGLAFNVKVFEALIVLPAIALLAWFAFDLPARRRLLAIGAGLGAFVAVSLSWVTAASLAPGSHPWPIGSSNGSVWNVVFVFNGIARLRGHASAAALAQDPPGPLRFLATSGVDYAALVGATLLAAAVFGTVALAHAVLTRRLRGRRRLGLAGAAFLGVWLVTGVGLLSHAQRMQPRYLEAVTPAIAGVLGVGVAWLAVNGRRRRLPAVALAASAAIVAVAGLLLVHVPAWAAVAALGGACACAALAAAPRRPPAALVAVALIAALSVPLAASVSVARQHKSNAGLALQAPPALSAFLISHQGSARYEVASSSVMRASPLIIRDARPVLMLTSYLGRPLISAATLAHAVSTGEVRYILMGPGDCAATGCAPAVTWAHAHARDISRATGVGPPGTLFELTSGARSNTTPIPAQPLATLAQPR
jgi:4-amino-4-deoxy-L-arabinose transferase-like glycosyltransferase